MASIKISIKNLPLLKKIAQKIGGLTIKRDQAQEIGRGIVEDMLKMMNAGVSPIAGKRFPQYKNPAKYPGDRKARSPVNLKLTGDFQNALRGRIQGTGKNSVTLQVGFFDKENADKERGHREGANTQPIRPVIPKEGETFAKSIQLNALRRLKKFFK